MEQEKKSLFETLSAINCNEHKEIKNNIAFLSWAWAWGEFRKVCPNATYEVYKDEHNNTDNKSVCVVAIPLSTISQINSL